MDLLELQQRANLLVNKINEYEENLVGQTVDEQEIINQHLYADIYCLRPVMKLLFGKDLVEKLDRTLDNNVNITLFASSVPAYNSKFTFYPISPQLTPVEPEHYEYTITGSPTITDGIAAVGSSSAITYSSTTVINRDDIKNFDETYAIVTIKFKINSRYTSTLTTLAQIKFNQPNDGTGLNYAPYVRASMSTADTLQMALSDNTAGSISASAGDIIEIKLKLAIQETSGSITLLSTSKNGEVIETTSAWKAGLTQTKRNNFKTLKPELIFGNTTNAATTRSRYYLAESGITLYQPDESLPFLFTSDTHEFMQNVDIMNAANMLQLEVQQNTVTSRDNRIKQGINYSYSANIQDALVTESQVANIFKWNTTNEELIRNNVKTINRQVPGIVCYYLGNDYTSAYTATIPYSGRYLNTVNYSTPSYYGAFYRKDDITQSQVGLNPGAECCRIFMPGMNYTRGKLQSPQQIWQPDKLVGDDNIDKGYNWQGQAIYHELVFKKRRTGAKDANVNFIPGLDSVPDNDVQGLATRTVLAQQKPYYHNRPWFTELNDLYKVNMGTLAEAIIAKGVITTDESEETSTMTDTQFYNQYKLDYDTWAEAFNQE